MAIFDAVLVGGSGPSGKYKAFAEKKADLQTEETLPWGEGSAVVCLNLDEDATGQSPSVHVKLPAGSWSGIQAADDDQEGEGNG